MSGLMPPNVLSYEGQVAIPFINRTFAPDASNYQFNVPTVWINTQAHEAFILVGKPMNVAEWLPFAITAGDIMTLSGEGGADTPSLVGNFNLSGSIAGGALADGAILFSTPSNGEMNAEVQVDGVTIQINASNQLEVIAGGSAVTEFNMQTGTTPVTPLAGAVTFNGAVVAAGTNPVRTDGTGANTMALEVQISQALAATDATKIGLCNFDSAAFDVDANGFVQLNGGGIGVTSFHPDSGTDPVVPTSAGLVNLVGSGSITTVGSLNTVTTQLTGLTNHAVLVGAGTSTITKIGPTATVGQVLQSAGAAADPAFSTATYPSTTTINQILYSSANNVVSGLATANRAVFTTGATGVPVATALATDGQLIIGSTAGVPAAATLTAGSGIAITNASNSITISSTGAGFAWSDTSGTFTAAKENGYFITATSTATLPASPAEGDTIAFIVDTTQILTITANTGQMIRVGTNLSASAGICVNNARGDSIELVYRSSGTTWFSLTAPQGTWTVT